MRIALLVERYFPYAATSWAQALAEGLTRLGFEPKVLSLSPEGDATRRVHGVEVTYVGAPGLLDAGDGDVSRSCAERRSLHNLRAALDPGLRARVHELLDGWDPELVQTCDLTGLGLLAAPVAAAFPQAHMILDHRLYAPCDGEHGCAAGVEPDPECQALTPSCAPFTTLAARFSRSAETLVSRTATLLSAHLWRGYFPRARLVRIVAACPGLQQEELASEMARIFQRAIAHRAIRSRRPRRTTEKRAMLEDPTLQRLLERAARVRRAEGESAAPQPEVALH